MSGIEIAILMGFFSLPAAAASIAVVMIVGDIKSSKQRKHFNKLVERCKQCHGISFTKKLLEKCIDSRLPMESMISVFEHHCQTPKTSLPENKQETEKVRASHKSTSSLDRMIMDAQSISDQSAQLANNIQKHKNKLEH